MLRQLLRPDFEPGYVEEIDLDDWWEQGLRGIILDVDDTLTRKNSPRIAPSVLSWLEAARQQGFALILVSNNAYPEHIQAVGERLNVLALAPAKKPRSRGFLWALEKLDLPPEQVVVVGDRLLTDVLGGSLMGLKTCLVRPVTRDLSPGKRILYGLEARLRNCAN